MTARTPDHAAILAAASFDAMPPLPRAVPVPPASASSEWSTSTISSMSDADASSRGSAVSRPGGVGEQHEQVGGDEVGDEGGEAVVVAEADLVVGDGVVLVDDGHDAEVEQPAERGPGVEVLLAHHEVERGEQHLAADHAVGGEAVLVHAHQAGLADGGRRLQGDGVARTAALRVARAPAGRRRWHRR